VNQVTRWSAPAPPAASLADAARDPTAAPAPIGWHFPLWPLLAATLLILYPLLVGEFFTAAIGAVALIKGVIALSLMFLAGYGGMVSLMQMTIAGLAGYIVAGLGHSNIGLDWPGYVAVPIAILGATLFGTLAGAISIRTTGIHTIMITLAIAVGMFYFAQQNYDLFNGFDGYAEIGPGVVFGLNWRDPVPFYYLCLAVAAVCFGAVWYVARAPFGLALQAIRDNDRRMRAIGFDVTAHRIAAYAFASCIAALGGVLLVWFNGRISPGNIAIDRAIEVLIIAVLGGMNRPVGVFIGALAFTLLQNFAIDLIDRERFNTVIGLAFLLIVLFSPDGLLGLWGRLTGWLSRMGAPRS
jgi:branched-chain amino acid transport system permease protein